MKKNTKPVSIILTLLITAFLLIVVFPTFRTNASSLDALFFFLSRMEADLDGLGDNAVEYIIAFAPSDGFDAGSEIEIFFHPDDDGEWCRSNGGLTITGITSAAPELTGTDYEIDAALPPTGTGLEATCTGGGVGTVDTIKIINVGALTAGDTYGFKLETNSGRLGTSSTEGDRTTVVQVTRGTQINASAFGLYILGDDTVTVTAEVEAAPSVECEVGSTTVDIGTIYAGGIMVQVVEEDQLGTSSTHGGYYWAAYGEGDGATEAGLYLSGATPYLIASTGSNTINISGGNSEGFGITVVPPTGATVFVPSDFQTGTVGQFGALNRTPAGARLILYKTDLTEIMHYADINYGARASAIAEAGAYTEEVTYVCGGYY
jgi:hypothetical protein